MRAVLDLDDVAPSVIGGRRIDPIPADPDGAPITREELQATMTEHAGVLRTAESLEQAAAAAARPPAGEGVAASEIANLAVIARAVCAAALAREETRGAHARVEFPERSPELAVRLIIQGGEPVATRQ